MEGRGATFLLIQIMLSISTSGVQALNSGRSEDYPSVRRQRRSPSSERAYFSFLTDHQRGGGGGGGGRPVFVTPNLRSAAGAPADPDQYWDFVLGSGTFKRRRLDDNRKFIRVRRDATSAASESRWPVFDVLGRRVKDEDSKKGDGFQTAAETGSDNGEKSVRDQLTKKTDEAFFPMTSAGENHDFYDFLLGEHGR